MNKQFIIYDFASNTFFVSVSDNGTAWGTPPMFFPSRETAELCLNNAFNLFPSEFQNRIIVITDVFIAQ